MCLSIPPELVVASVMGHLKGKSAITIAREIGGRKRNFTEEVYWTRGHIVSMVGLDEQVVRA